MSCQQVMIFSWNLGQPKIVQSSEYFIRFHTGKGMKVKIRLTEYKMTSFENKYKCEGHNLVNLEKLNIEA